MQQKWKYVIKIDNIVNFVTQYINKPKNIFNIQKRCTSYQFRFKSSTYNEKCPLINIIIVLDVMKASDDLKKIVPFLYEDQCQAYMNKNGINNEDSSFWDNWVGNFLTLCGYQRIEKIAKSFTDFRKTHPYPIMFYYNTSIITIYEKKFRCKQQINHWSNKRKYHKIYHDTVKCKRKT